MSPAAKKASGVRASIGGRALWAAVLFVALSLWARSGFQGIPPASPEWDALLGAPPPVGWIDTFLVIYLFSALILALTRMGGKPVAYSGFLHLGFLAGFYIFYQAADTLPDHFWAVFVGGSAVLTLEGYRYHLQCRGPREEP